MNEIQEEYAHCANCPNDIGDGVTMTQAERHIWISAWGAAILEAELLNEGDARLVANMAVQDHRSGDARD